MARPLGAVTAMLVTLGTLVAAEEVSVDVVVPGEGEVMPFNGQFHLNAFVDGMTIPQEGYATVFVNRKQIGKFENNHFMLSRSNPLRKGDHSVTVRVFNNKDEEILSHVTNFKVDDVEMEPFDGFVTTSTPVPSHSTATGNGLSQANAGVPATFSIVLRDEHDRVVLSREPPKLVAVITPAPLDNSLMASETGEYICSYEAQYGGMDHSISIMLNDQHIQGSPFQFRSNTSYTVNVVKAITPSERPPSPDLSVPKIARSNPRVREFFVPQKWMELGTAATGGAGRFAYVTMITGDDYLIGALVLLHCLRRVGVSDTDILVMVTQNVREDTIAMLAAAGFGIRRVTKVDIPHKDMVEARWSDNYTKLLMWQMIEYDRIVYLDADMLVLQPIDHLFHINLGPANFAATPDCWLPTFFSAAMFVFKPSMQTYDAMMAVVPDLPAEESEQTFLNEFFFESWMALHYSHNTPKNYGMTPTRFRFMIERHMNDVRVIHYMGLKPFQCTRYKDCTAHTGHYNIPEWYDLWWSKFDEMCDSDAVQCK